MQKLEVVLHRASEIVLLLGLLMFASIASADSSIQLKEDEKLVVLTVENMT